MEACTVNVRTRDNEVHGMFQVREFVEGVGRVCGSFLDSHLLLLSLLAPCHLQLEEVLSILTDELCASLLNSLQTYLLPVSCI